MKETIFLHLLVNYISRKSSGFRDYQTQEFLCNINMYLEKYTIWKWQRDYVTIINIYLYFPSSLHVLYVMSSVVVYYCSII